MRWTCGVFYYFHWFVTAKSSLDLRYFGGVILLFGWGVTFYIDWDVWWWFYCRAQLGFLIGDLG